MKKITALFFTALFLCYALTNSTRHQPGFHKESSVATQYQDVEAVDKNCEGVGEEECLMRKTLIANTDYIYTDNYKP
ncbi:hypothetical protein Lal_00026261 [Lupinus albus]|uniref:Phytosulfokine n=1 Tax=Lupinus albus TaxID=3870 RepID=A0A6A4PZM7_LUPAL|nr:putative phytosulfokine [Lupinus albus]KAF1861810.1 hypothetical protein Lal_00026261 [Lupinus albus]